ncbi:PREDICTED: uncharacterized protein LOC109152121 [Ipomoea nil]|uniref:uncharacterized protein LOC109152121 n=1 Tax=Ipomoea nil TaxID=35883 RepID=UPI000900CA34|nr:PREDICTED: uncharacterized protein LOC109152121 [Ipomoea nil]
MTSHKPKQWIKWIALAEHWYNTNFHCSLQSTPFQALYGYPPPQIAVNASARAIDESSEQWVQERMSFLAVMRDRNRSERTLQVGDWVFLKLQPYRQSSVAIRRNLKLCSNSIQVAVAFGDSNPPVFHVSQLKKKVGSNATAQLQAPLVGPEGQLLSEPVAISDRRILKKNNAAVVEVLVQWANLLPEEATWEEYHHLKAQFPEFDP